MESSGADRPVEPPAFSGGFRPAGRGNFAEADRALSQGCGRERGRFSPIHDEPPLPFFLYGTRLRAHQRASSARHPGATVARRYGVASFVEGESAGLLLIDRAQELLSPLPEAVNDIYGTKRLLLLSNRARETAAPSTSPQ